MNPAVLSIKNRLICSIVILGSLFGGWMAYQNMPRLEDPSFLIREAQVITQYPGATPIEVANEVSDKLVTAIQTMPELKEVKSISTPGLSTLKLTFKYEAAPNKAALARIFATMRTKIKDAEIQLPPGVTTPMVFDDVGDVYGIYFVITSEGFTSREMRDYAKSLRTQMLAIKGVGKVQIKGDEPEAIYIEISQEHIAEAGVSVDQVFDQLSKNNSVVSAGSVLLDEQSLTVQLSPTEESVEVLKNTVVSVGQQGRVVRLRDIATVTRGYQDPKQFVMRYNGLPAIGLGISVVAGENIVAVEKVIATRMAELESERPIGLELATFYNQGTIVDASVKDFATNVVLALAIVLVTLGIFMGVSTAILIGGVLVLTIAATLTVMNFVGIPMHRISLGALIIALGMLVDNAIVVTDGILVGVKAGHKKIEIAGNIVAKTWLPLLGGTLVGIIAFAPIGLSPGNMSEYAGSLFWVILISLSFSWVFAMTIAPMFADLLFRENTADKTGLSGSKPDGAFKRGYKSFIRFVLRVRYLIIAAAFGAFALAVVGFSYVEPGFFPASTTPQIVVNYWLPEGTSIDRTNADLKVIETHLKTLDGVNAVHTLVGGGTIRYMLTYAPESPNSSYGQILLKLEDYKQIAGLLPVIQDYIDGNFPNGRAKVWRFALGPGGGSKIEARFEGPDPVILRKLANQAKAVMSEDPNTISIKDDWRQSVRVVQPIVNDTRARRLGITREEISSAINVNYSGRNVGLFREGVNLIPIVQRAVKSERQGIQAIGSIQVASRVTGKSIPLRQLVDGFQTVWRDGIIIRINRVWSITAQSDPDANILSGDLFNRLRPKIEAIELPPGYSLIWKGEYGDSQEANGDLVSAIPMGFAAMVLVIVLLFNAIRQPVIILLTLPLAIIGVVVGLLVMKTPLEFIAIVGVLSLSGLLIKNAIVLVDQMDHEIRDGKPRFDAVVDSAASRVRPVLMGSITTVLGVLPLYGDAFFRSLAVVLSFGLSFATVLTLVIIPALYAVFFRIKSTERAATP